MWIFITIGILAVILGLIGILVMRKGRQKLDPMPVGMAIGGIVGMVAGITLVEVWEYEYPLPFILWLLGMAVGQIAGWLYKRKK